MYRLNASGLFALVMLTGGALVGAGCTGVVDGGADGAADDKAALETPPPEEGANEECDGEPANDPVNACVASNLGDGVTCINDGNWKQLAYDSCTGQGLVLVDLKFADDCPNGESTHVEHVCCNQPPPPPPGSPTCTGGGIGDGTTCETPEALEAQAAAICEADGLPLQEIYFSEDCPNGGSKFAKFMCCDQPPPPPPPPDSTICTYGVLGDGTTCQADDALEDQATAICDGQGYVLEGFGVSMDCANGGSTYAKFACCEP